MIDSSTMQRARERVIAYHETTKHHPHRYARSLGYLDWATQPDPFRRYTGAPVIPLPLPAPMAEPAYDDLFNPGGITPQPLTRDCLSRFFYLSLAISAWKQVRDVRWALRCNPSSGNLHPTEGYVLLPAIGGLTDAPGLFHYAPREHALEMRAVWPDAAWATLSECLPEGAFLAGLTSIHWREAWKYGERAFRYCNHDAGHALAAMRLAAAVLGWRLLVLDELADADVACLLGIDRDEEFEPDEPEHPDLLALIWPHDAPPPETPIITEAVLEAAAEIKTLGKANRLSGEHVAEWEIIDEAARACEKPATPPAGPRTLVAQPTSDLHPARAMPHVSAWQIIRQRRSAVAFDGRTSISAETFYAMLARVMPLAGDNNQAFPPWDTVSWRPRVHLGLFVHLVDHVAPGLYALVRDPVKVDALREAMDSEFQWTKPTAFPADLPLYCLMDADCRRAAVQLSLGQDIAGMSAFSLGMLAEFEESLHDKPWMYRRLFWEAGMVGQVLYLEAEAAGVRSTGIGAYFDDPVHEVFGLSGRKYQSLYHFTVGGHVDDPRLSTLPSYPPPD